MNHNNINTIAHEALIEWMNTYASPTVSQPAAATKVTALKS